MLADHWQNDLEEAQRRHASEGTHFVKYRRSAVVKEALNLIERGRAEVLEDAQPKTLSERRIDSIEDGVRSRTFNPRRTAIGE